MAPRNQIIRGDALEVLRSLPPASVDLVLTSPPYFQLRRYGDDPRELGREPDVEHWVAQLLAVTREVHRVLAPHGAFYLNIADSYSRHPSYGAPAKSLLLGPESPTPTRVIRPTGRRPRVCCSDRSGWPQPCFQMGGWCATASSGPSRIRCPARLPID